jgi:hypothetical protein
MSIDNENDAMDTENPGNAGVATAPSLDDLDAAMAALIRAASPSESTQAQSSQEPARSGPAMALVNSVSIMDEDDDDDFFDDEEEDEQGAAPAPVAQQRPSAPPAPIPFRAPQAQQEQPTPAPAPAPAQYSPPLQAPQAAPAPVEHSAPQQYAPQPAAQPEYVAQQPSGQPDYSAQTMAAPQAQPQLQPQPAPQPQLTPQPVPYQQPAPIAQTVPQQSSVSQHARATLMHENNQEKHLHDASKYIRAWLEENFNDEEVIEAAMDWARKHKTAEHNGHVIASLLVLEGADNEVTVMAVRWLTHHSMHTLAPEIVAGLTRRQ